jgi:hypothetical protein
VLRVVSNMSSRCIEFDFPHGPFRFQLNDVKGVAPGLSNGDGMTA